MLTLAAHSLYKFHLLWTRLCFNPHQGPIVSIGAPLLKLILLFVTLAAPNVLTLVQLNMNVFQIASLVLALVSKLSLNITSLSLSMKFSISLLSSKLEMGR